MFHVIVNANSIVQLAIQIKNEIMINANASVKAIVQAKKVIVGILAYAFCENSKYLKHIVDDSMIARDEIVYVMNIVSTNMANAIKTIMTNTISTNMSTNYDRKKVRYKMDCYIFHTVLLMIILLFIIAIICYHDAKYRSKLKKRIAVVKI